MTPIVSGEYYYTGKTIRIQTDVYAELYCIYQSRLPSYELCFTSYVLMFKA